MEKLYDKSETGCCPRFNPKPWDRKTVRWKGKLFLKEHILCIFNIPVGFGGLMKRDMEVIKDAGALSPEPIMLFDHTSPFGADVYIAVKKEVPGKKSERISGAFLCRAFEGPYKDMGKFVREMQAYVKFKGKDIKRLYFYYTTCPACAKAYGKNYTVLLSKI